MNDMAQFTEAKSDQLNADDLIAGPITVTITGVTIKGGEQPVAINYQGDKGKPYKPGKSMVRMLVAAWGSDSKSYVGKSMTLFREPTVKWAGMEVGGIRISHMSHIKNPLTMPLSVTKGVKKLFTVAPLKDEKPADPTPEQKAAAAKKKADEIIARIAACGTVDGVTAVCGDEAGAIARLGDAYQEQFDRITDARDFKIESLSQQPTE